MLRASSIQNAIGVLICILLLVLVGLEVQQIRNEAACGARAVVTPTR